MAVLAHVGLDLINAYGVALLYPWSTFRYELPLAFILDPILTGVLLTGVLVPFVIRDTRLGSVLSRSTLLLVGCYLAACFGLRMIANSWSWRAQARPGETFGLILSRNWARRCGGREFTAKAWAIAKFSSIRSVIVSLISLQCTQHLTLQRWPPCAPQRPENGSKPSSRPRSGGPKARPLSLMTCASGLARLVMIGIPLAFVFDSKGGGFAPVQETLSTYVANWRKAFLGFGSTITSCAAARTGLEPDAH